MNHHCWMGTCFTEMDVRLELAKKLLEGAKVTPKIWECPQCGCWHYGLPKAGDMALYCSFTRKLSFPSEEKALEQLAVIAEKRNSGQECRKENRAYQCEQGHWHLTSKEY